MKPRRLPSGSWNIRLMIGGHTYSFTHSDRKTVMRMAADFADEHRRRVANPTLSEALADYIEANEKRLSPSTTRAYAGILRMIQSRNPNIAQKRISALTDSDVLKIVRPPRTLKTKRNYVNFIHAATGKGSGLKLYGKASKQTRVPTDLEIKGLLEIFKDSDMEIPIMLAAYGGLRRGEICALTLSDIKGDYVYIDKDMVRDDLGQWIIKPPKTQSSIRRVLLPHFVIQKIIEHGSITELLPYQVSNRFWKTQARLGIVPYSFHSLRHYNASYLHAIGIPDAYIMARGGWATPHIMQSVYRHALADRIDPMDLKAVESFQNTFQN